MSNAPSPSGQPSRIVLENRADGKVTVNIFFAGQALAPPTRHGRMIRRRHRSASVKG